jgi:hypothetical protein
MRLAMSSCRSVAKQTARSSNVEKTQKQYQKSHIEMKGERVERYRTETEMRFDSSVTDRQTDTARFVAVEDFKQK